MSALLALASGCVASEEGDVVAASPAELHDELARARPGDVVSVGGGRFVGSFVVPAGVTLRGAGAGATTIQGDGAGPAITLQTGTGVTSVSDLAIASPADRAITITGPGEASIASVHVDVQLGMGIVAERVARVTVRDTTVSGSVTEATARMILGPTPERYATHGLVLDCVGEALIERFSVRGFASFGALFVGSRVRWLGGGARENRAVGVMTYGGTLELDGIEIARTFETVEIVPPYGLVVIQGATLSASRLLIEDIAGYAVFQAESTATYASFIVRNNRAAGLYVMGRSSVSIEDAVFADNSYGAIVAFAPEALTIRRAAFERTQLSTRVVGETGTADIGDGLLIAQPWPETLVLEDVSLYDNARVGALVDLGGGTLAGAIIERVTVGGDASALGFIVQNGSFDPGWDASVTRLGATATNDALLYASGSGAVTLLEGAAPLAPPTEPRPDPFGPCR